MYYEGLSNDLAIANSLHKSVLNCTGISKDRPDSNSLGNISINSPQDCAKLSSMLN